MNVIPSFLKVLFIVELFERISYYGVRTLLVLFLIDKYGFQDINAYATYSVFAALAYSSPVISGYLADKIFGFRRMVILGGIIITIAHILILSSLYNSLLFFFGLGLLVLGTGFFKSNINSLLGACYHENDPNRIHGFTFLHVGVNIGSALASILCGYIAHYYGWYYGFGIAFISILISMAVFFKNEHYFGSHGSSMNPGLLKRKYHGISFSKIIFFLCMIVGLMFGKILADNLFSIDIFYYFGAIMVGVFIYVIARSDTKKELIALALLMICLIVFFAMEMQLGSLFALFSQRNVVQTLFGYQIPATVSQSINPISIMVIGFIITARKARSNKYEIMKFIGGILTTTVCFGVLYYGCLHANAENRIAYIYFLIAVFMTGVGELIVWPFVQSKITELSPKHLRGFIMGLVMLFMAFANVVGIFIGRFFAIDVKNGIYDSAASLAIYSHGFKLIAIYNLLFVILFLPVFYFIKKVIQSKNIQDKNMKNQVIQNEK